jgi:pimeloyl-ACP methyl ester carboxylesterase
MVKQIEVGPEGARLGYVEFDGDGPALVFLHGLGACSPLYFARTAIEPVLAGRRALMIDFLGFGISDRPAGFGYTLEDHADSIARALDTLGLEGVDMVAHSMGGSIALVLASRRPDLMSRLVLVEPNLRPTARPRVEPFTEATFVQFGFEQALTAVGPEWAATMRLADPIALYRTELALGRGTTPMMDELLLNLAVPCVLVEGERTSALADAPSKCVSGIRVLIVPGAGHTMMLDNPVAFARVIAEALDELATRPLHLASRDL